MYVGVLCHMLYAVHVSTCPLTLPPRSTVSTHRNMNTLFNHTYKPVHVLHCPRTLPPRSTASTHRNMNTLINQFDFLQARTHVEFCPRTLPHCSPVSIHHTFLGQPPQQQGAFLTSPYTCRNFAHTHYLIAHLCPFITLFLDSLHNSRGHFLQARTHVKTLPTHTTSLLTCVHSSHFSWTASTTAGGTSYKPVHM